MTAIPAPRPAEGSATRTPSVPRAFVPVLCATAFVIGATLIGLAVGPVPIGIGAIARSAASHIPLLHVHSSMSAEDRRSSGSCGRRGSCSGCSSAACSRWRAAPTRACSATRWWIPYLLGVAAGAGLGATLAISYGGGDGRSVRPAAGGRVPRRGVRRCLRLRPRLGRRGRPQPGDARARGRDGRLVPDRGPDLRPAAALPVAAGRSTLDPRSPRHRRLARRRADGTPYSSSARP